MLEVWQFRHVDDLLIFASHFSLHDVWFQSLVEVGHAGNSVGDGEEDEDNNDNGEDGQRLSHREILVDVARLVHADDLEDEVCETGVVTYNNQHHSHLVLATSPEGGHHQDENGDGKGSNSKTFLGVWDASDNDQELDCETEEEEEIELEKSDINL